MSKIYRGDRTIDGILVTVDGEPLPERTDIKEISSDGFEWSYEGAAPAQLALAILADHLGDPTRALAMHDVFMRHIVANFNNEWELRSEDIDDALGALGYEPGRSDAA
mgnify:CR=1 FL=1